MLDLTGIMVSSIMMLIVIVRAVQLDSRMPWFERPSDPDTSPTGLERARANAARHIPAWRRRWLRDIVHAQGSRLGFNDLLVAAIGKPLDPTGFEAHLMARYLG